MPASTALYDGMAFVKVQSSTVPTSKLGFSKNCTEFSEHDTIGVTVDITGTICARSASKERLLPKVDTIAMFSTHVRVCKASVVKQNQKATGSESE